MAIVKASITKPLYNGVAMLALQNNKTAAMLLFKVKPVSVRTLFCNRFLLFQQICIAPGYVSKIAQQKSTQMNRCTSLFSVIIHLNYFSVSNWLKPLDI